MALTINQVDDQQLMYKTNFGPIHNQPYLLQMTGYTCQPASGNGFITGINIDCQVNQQSAQGLDKLNEFVFPGIFTAFRLR